MVTLSARITQKCSTVQCAVRVNFQWKPRARAAQTKRTERGGGVGRARQCPEFGDRRTSS